MGLLTDKVAVITGGISGLGRASALRYASEGATVVVADINAEKGANAAAEMSAGGAAIEFIQVDVTSKESQQALFDDVVSRYGRVDTVLAAAGFPRRATSVVRSTRWRPIQKSVCFTIDP